MGWNNYILSNNTWWWSIGQGGIGRWWGWFKDRKKLKLLFMWYVATESMIYLKDEWTRYEFDLPKSVMVLIRVDKDFSDS